MKPGNRKTPLRQLQTWHALLIAAVQIAGLTVWHWSPLDVWWVFLVDDFCLALSSWARTGWAHTKTNEDWQERSIAVFGHAFIDLITLVALATALVVLTPWPKGTTIASVWSAWFNAGVVWGLLAALLFTLLQWPTWWHSDRSGALADIDEIRTGSGLLTRFWVANVALLLGLPFMGGSSADLAATLALVVLRTAWTIWFDRSKWRAT